MVCFDGMDLILPKNFHSKAGHFQSLRHCSLDIPATSSAGFGNGGRWCDSITALVSTASSPRPEYSMETRAN
jgi:hypothetical protein